MNDKFSMRKTMRKSLNNVATSTLQQASSKICQQLKKIILSNQKNPTVATFAAHGVEVNLSDLHQILPEAELVYPLCLPKNQLSFHHVKKLRSLTPGMLKILEPLPAKHPEVSISEIDFFICPGLAFGKDLTRLGHGGGYYDRALEKRKVSAKVIGVAFNSQIHPTVPHDLHDIRMDKIVTEQKII